MTKPLITDKKGRQWFEETVVVRKEGEGYGITLAEAQPVFIQRTVKNGPADKAGVQVGDRIVKVNGQSIMNKSHSEVVSMVKNSSFVSFTLMRRVQSSGTKEDSGQSKPIAGNGFVPLLEQQSKMSRDSSAFSLQNLKTALQKKRAAYEKLAVQFSKTHDDSLTNEIMDHQLIIQDLEQQIAAQSPSINSHIKATQASIAAMRGHQRSHSDSSKLAKLIEQQAEREVIQASLPQPSTTAPAKHPTKVVTISDVVENISVPPTKQSRFWNPFSSSDSKGKSSSSSNITAPPQPGSRSPPSPVKGKDATMDISPISSDNEEDMNISEGVSPFQSLQVLKTAPAHMATFLCYMLGMKNKDPTKLCFYLVIQSYQDTRCKPVEMKQRALDIYLTFVHPNSPLHLDLGEKHEGIASRILNTIQNEELPMKLTPVFKDVRGMIQQSIENDLVEFQQKRMIGLGWMFGDQKLSEHMSHEEIVEVVYSNLQKPLKDLMEDMEDKDLTARNRILALASCVATFMLDLGRPKNKANEPVNFDKLSSITKCDVRKMKQKRKSEVRQGHQLLPTIFSTYVLCDKCSQLIWSIGVHGMQCSYCDVNVHYAEECMSEIPPCSRDKRKKHKRSLTEPSESSYEELEERQAEWEALNGSSASYPDIRSPVTKERSQSLTETKLPPLPHVGEFRERSHQVNRTLSDRIPDKPHPPGRLRSLDASLTSSASITSFPGVRLHGMDEVRGRSGGLSPLPEIVKSSPIDADVEVDLQDNDLNVKDELVPWALAVGKEVVEKYNKHEKQRQELIREFVHTEKTHLKKLKVMLYLYKKPLIRQKIISYERVLQLFPNLEELILIHGMLLTDLKGREADSGVHVEGISDILLQRFDGEAGERLNKACAVFASNQAMAVRLFKEWKKTDERFKHFVKVAESHPMCGRLKLAELIPIPWTRLTKYRLLVEAIVAEYKTQVKKGVLSAKDRIELDRLETVLSRVKSILHDVNIQVKSTENHCKLLDYQARLDTSGLEKSSNKLANFYGNLDISAKGRQLLHEGSLTWKLQNKKIELHGLLLTDILVLMEKDLAHDRFFLRTHTQIDFKGDKDELCPVVKVSETLWRDAATDRSKRTFFLASNSPLMEYAVKYELLAESAAKREEWCVAFHNATTAVAKGNHGDEDSMSYVSSDTTMSPLRSPSPTSPQPRDPDTLYKIDEAIVKLLEDKMAIVRGMNTKDERMLKEASVESVESIAPELDTPVSLACAAIEQACIMVSAANAFLVPDQQIPSFSTAQTAIAEHAVTLQRHLTALMRVLSGSVDQQEDETRKGSTHTLVAELRIDSPSSEQTPQEGLKPNDEDTAPVISGLPNGSSSSVLDRKESEEDENYEDEDSEQVATVQDNVIMLFDPSDNPERLETNVVGESVGGNKSDSEDADIPPPPPEVPPPLPDVPPPPPEGPPPPESPLCSEGTNHFSLLTDESNVLISQLLKSGNSQTSLSSYTEDDGTLIAPPPPPLFAADLDHEMPTLVEVPKENNTDKENQPLTDNSVDGNDPPPLPSVSPPEMKTPENMPKNMHKNTPTCDGGNAATTGIFLQEQGSSEA